MEGLGEVKLPSVMATEIIEELVGIKRNNLTIPSKTKIQFVMGLKLGFNVEREQVPGSKPL